MYHPTELALTEALAKKELLDISAPIGTAPLYPGDRKFTQQWMAGFEEGSDFRLSAITLGSHAGTHLDFPSHIFRDGRAQNSYPLERFITPAQVISVQDADAVSPQDLQDVWIERGEAILFKTGNSSQRLICKPIFSPDYVHVSIAAAKICITKGAGLVGIDYLSVDRYEDESLPVHNILLKNDVLVLEGIDLGAVPPGRYWLICLPLRIDDAEAAPVRAVLVR